MSPDQMPRNSQRDGPDAPAWNGEGLPPVGCECEYLYSEGNQWRKGYCAAHYRGQAVIVDDEDYGSECCIEQRVRPIFDANPCRFHDDDAEACETYSGQVPCEPEPPAWDGESWPPPIGCVLEAFASDRKGAAAEVLAVRRGHVIGCTLESAMPGFLLRDECRPLKSEQDKAVEELQKAIIDYSNNALFDDEPLMLAEALYRAGYRKEARHDAG